MQTRIQTITRYPVKSMAGETLQTTELGPRGVPGDRAWAIRDESARQGGIQGGKRFPQLMNLSASSLEEATAAQPSPAAEVRCPDGSRFLTTDSGAAERLTHLLNHPVSLWPLRPATETDHYRRPPPQPGQDRLAGLRAVFARTDDEPLPDLSGFPAELSDYASPPGSYFDAFPLLIMSTSALSAMADAASESNFDVRRFRPNLLLETASAGFPEEAWAGRRLRIGGAVVRIAMACPRCIMATHGFADLPSDPGIMRALVQRNAGNLGVYATVVQPGRITLGDVAEVLDA